MLLDGTEVDLRKTSIDEIVSEIIRRHPKPKGLEKAVLRFSLEEERALDAHAGMMWPCIFRTRLQKRYGAIHHRIQMVTGQISFFGDRAIILKFKAKA